MKPNESTKNCGEIAWEDWQRELRRRRRYFSQAERLGQKCLDLKWNQEDTPMLKKEDRQ